VDTNSLPLLLAFVIIILLIGVLIYQIKREATAKNSGIPPNHPPEEQQPPPAKPPEIHTPASPIQPELNVASPEPPKYQKRRYFFSHQERKFYDALLNDLDDDLQVFAKVRIADIVWLTNEPKDKWQHLNRILTRHVDFLICDVRQQIPLVAVELDDSSHNRVDRQESDRFKDTLFAHVQMPLERFQIKDTYEPGEIGKRIRDSIDRSSGQLNA